MPATTLAPNHHLLSPNAARPANSAAGRLRTCSIFTILGASGGTYPTTV